LAGVTEQALKLLKPRSRASKTTTTSRLRKQHALESFEVSALLRTTST
jgi:hypothetical protein